MKADGRTELSAVAGSGLWLSPSQLPPQPPWPRQIRSLARRSSLEEGFIFLIVIASSAAIITAVVGTVYFKRRKQRKQAGKYQQALGDDNLEAQANSHQLGPAPPSTPQSNRNRASNRTLGGNNAAAAAATTASASPGIPGTVAAPNPTVDRNASIRSVMTLPAYRQTASHTEQVLGREGERDGIDTIVDLPTEEEQEALRDEEMEAMYQIRVARRQQIDEQQQRRVERREARSRGDTGALAEIRARTRAASNSNPIDSLRREMDRAKELRQKSVSSVSYADLGVARHDGTRIRASSNDSERMALLSEVATGESSQLAARPRMHHREPSVGSVLSLDSDFPSPRPSHSRGGSQSASLARAGSSPELVEADLGEEAIPPPEYEDISLADGNDDDDDDGGGGSSFHTRPSINEPPPDYSGPFRSASQRSHGIPRLPSLRINQLPEIVIEPSSALSRDGHGRGPDLLATETR